MVSAHSEQDAAERARDADPGPGAQVLVASNRGPVSYALTSPPPRSPSRTPTPDGASAAEPAEPAESAEPPALTAKRGGGGLVSGLSAIGADARAVWVCAALGDGDREAVRQAAARAPGADGPTGAGGSAGALLDTGDTGGQRVRMLDIAPEVFAAAYNGIANSVLWFVHHLLYQTPLEPAFDAEFQREWKAYEAYNAAFADALAREAAPGAAVLVQDYHLSLVPALLRERRPDLRIGHFSHTPWAPPDYFRMLPDDVANAVLRGILGGDRAGFLTERWAEAFADCCARVLGARVERDAASGELTVELDGRTAHLGVHGLGADAEFLRERSRAADVVERRTALRAQVEGRDADGGAGESAQDAGGGRKVIVRVDRTELSKNIVRGLLAYRRLLADRPEWRERVVHVAFAYPSRQDLAVYREYTQEVRRVADAINEEFGTPGWRPVVLHVKDDFARSLAAYRIADVALVNPIRDGMNLVAKEVPVVSDAGCALVLSREAGAQAELGDAALTVNPYDVRATADALHEALTMDPGERAERTKRLAAAATALPPQQWFLAELRALGAA